MKKFNILIVLLSLILIQSAMAQAPIKFSYQGIARNASGTPIANQALGLRLSILDGSATGSVVYSETQTATTNAYGLYDVQIGAGTILTGTLKSVAWAVGDKYLLVEIDPKGGSSYINIGASQLLSVPYALNALNAQYPVNPLWSTGSGNNIYNSSFGNVGLNTTAPNNKLQIGDPTAAFSDNDLAIGNGAQGMSFSQLAAASTWFSNTNFALMPNGNGGNVGIGTTAPICNLQVVSSLGTYGFLNTAGNVQLGTYIDGSAAPAGWFGTRSNHPLWLFTNNQSSASIAIATNGNVGIGTVNPVSKVQIGSVGSSGYKNDDLAIGNGSQAMAFALTPTVTSWYSTTGDIGILPGGTGHGRVGINTNSPFYPLDVRDYITGTSEYYAYFNDGHPSSGLGSFNSKYEVIVPNISIYAEQNILASEFDAHSDARIKSITDISNSAKDLRTLCTIEITDYTMKDKVKYGDKPFKKVIAQQVEKVYPQVVSQSVNFIPNVYQCISSIKKLSTGYLLSFRKEHNLSKEARKLQIVDKNSRGFCSIVSIPSAKQVIVDAPHLSDSVFVYGEQVHDFRTVDYDGLTTLNISATQELSKLVNTQAAQIEVQRAQIQALQLANKEMKTSLNEVMAMLLQNKKGEDRSFAQTK